MRDGVTIPIPTGGGGGGTPKFDPVTLAYNVTPETTRRTRIALAAARAGTRPMGIMQAGDSITAGAGSGGRFNVIASGARLRPMLAGRLGGGVREVLLFDTGVFGDGGGASSDPRFTVAAGDMSVQGFALGVGGQHMVIPSGSPAKTVTVTPHHASGPKPGLTWDTVRVWWYAYQADAAPTLTIDGGSPTTPPNTGGPVRTATVTAGSVGTHTLTIAGSTTANVRLLGVEFSSSTTPDLVRVAKMGWGGVRSDIWSDNDGQGTLSSRRVSFTWDPNLDVAFIMLGTNDGKFLDGYVNPVPKATFQANINALATAAKTAGLDAVLVTPPPFPDTGAGLATYADYYGGPGSAYYNVADEVGCVVLDLGQRWGSFANVNGARYGFMSDGAHPAVAGHYDIAALEATYLDAIAH